MPYSERYMLRKIEDAIKTVKPAIYTKIAPLSIKAYVTDEPVKFNERFSGEEKILTVGQSWGKLWDCAWFCFEGRIPESERNKNLVLMLDISGEMCVFDKAGVPVACLTNVSSEYDTTLGAPGKRIFILDKETKESGEVSVWADAGCNDLFGKYQDSGRVMEVDIAVCDSELRDIYYDLCVVYDMLECLDKNTARYKRLLGRAYDAACYISSPDFDRNMVKRILKTELERKGGDSSLRVTGIGHAHIDLAWLWPVRETKRKGARTFSNVISLMERYPDFIFGASQPQLYKWVKEDYPELYEKIKQKVKENRWECQGGMWVEADTNVSGAEPLVRQFLYGKKFFMDEFGVDARSLWLPDVFGYSAALPQILKLSGVDYFVTQKLSWSEHNKHPHHTFNWVGIDGTSVLAHLCPEDTYNGSAMPRSLKKIERNYKDNAVCEEALMLFGIGDGGGGPSTFHLESLKRIKNSDGLVPCEQGYSIDMLDRIDADKDKYSKWVGELYLERHQGTYTTQSRIKRYNRRVEFALRETEFACVWAKIAAGTEYPKAELDTIWEEYLLYQFHDILPGSSINRVYREAEEGYKAMLKRLSEIKKAAFTAVAATVGRMNESMVFNSLPFEVTEQFRTTGGYRTITVPAMGMKSLDESVESYEPCISDSNKLENSKLVVTFGENGEITAVYDKVNDRNVLLSGKSANVINVYNDRGDAWDMRFDYMNDISETMKLESVECTTEGANAVRTQVFSYGESLLKQKIVLTSAGVVRFDTEIDWRERRRMLRTAFPINVVTDKVECDIQFGSLERSTTENTSWQYAQFEICAQKWVDLSQHDYGAAVLNNGKYGYRVKDTTIDINLLRSPCYPDTNADYGKHAFTYALYPHKGGRVEAKVNEQAYALNMPLSVVKVGSEGQVESGISTQLIKFDNGGSAVIESIKAAEDGKGIIVRVYESAGADCSFTLTPAFRFQRASVVNLIENEVTECAVSAGVISAELKPYQILSIKIN